MAVLFSRRSPLFSIFFFVICFFKQGTADFDSTLCDKYKGTGENTKTTPYFYDDFHALTEVTTYAKDGSIQGRITQRKIRYSASHKQLDINVMKSDAPLYYYVDVDGQACTLGCETEPNTCSKIQQAEPDYLQMNGNNVALTDSAKKLWWPTDSAQIKSIVMMKKGSEVRNVKTNKYVTCAYVSATDITTVAEWQVLDLDNYKKMDITKNIVLMATFHQSQNKATLASRRIDFFVYKQLSADELQYGLQIPEQFCRHSTFRMQTTVPKFPLRFSSLLEVDSVVNEDVDHVTRYDQRIEYNAMSQTIKVKNYHDRNDENEKEVSYKYTDYSTKHIYSVSQTTGNCSIDKGDKNIGDMPNPKGFWSLENPEPFFIHKYRDIPCIGVHSWDSKKPTVSAYVMIATPEWLKDQGRDEDEFYPVHSEYFFSGKEQRYTSIFEFKQNPGYHFPNLRRCFDQDTNVDATVVLRTHYESNVKEHATTFNYELRTLLKMITGIKASLRLSNFHFAPYKEYTKAFFTIYGDERGKDRTVDKAYYASDPVTSQEAAAKIKKAVDAGEKAFTFKRKKISVSFEKGSFKQFSYQISKQNASVSGHSNGAMAGIGIAMFLVGLVLAAGFVFGYKKYSQGSLPALSFSFGKEGV